MFWLESISPIAKGDLKWRDALLVAHCANSNNIRIITGLRFTNGGCCGILQNRLFMSERGGWMYAAIRSKPIKKNVFGVL